MKTKLVMFFLFILLIVGLTSCKTEAICEGATTSGFSQFLLDVENLNNMTLTIYYLSPLALSNHISAENLMSGTYDNKIVIPGSVLEEFADYLKKLTTELLIPIEQEYRLNARLVYVFETKKDGTVLMIASGVSPSIFVNDEEFAQNNVFFDAIRPFMTEDALSVLRIFFGQ